jgi:predicted RNA-binding Zn ribbon-like protein
MSDPEFTLLGDALWLDFVNSARGRAESPPDLIPTTEAYLRWVGAQHLERETEPPPLSVVREFRAHLTAIAEALRVGRQPPASAIEALNQRLASSGGTQQVTRVGGEWRLRFAPARPGGPLEAIARSAAATLTDPLVAVRQCAADHCSLFFTAGSAGASRHWCDMSICGRDARVERRRGMLR